MYETYLLGREGTAQGSLAAQHDLPFHVVSVKMERTAMNMDAVVKVGPCVSGEALKGAHVNTVVPLRTNECTQTTIEGVNILVVAPFPLVGIVI